MLVFQILMTLFVLLVPALIYKEISTTKSLWLEGLIYVISRVTTIMVVLLCIVQIWSF